jgi:integrase
MAGRSLTALAVSKLKEPGRYAVGDGAYLQITGDTGRSWLFRYRDRRTGRAKQMGLGPADLVTLAEAREKARACRKLLLDGVDPMENRAAVRERAKLEAARSITFKQAAERYIADNEAKWRNAEHRRHWRAAFEQFAFPRFGNMAVGAIDTATVLEAVQPIWTMKTSTASRLRNRIELVLDWATAQGMREGMNPARWRGHLDKVLPKPSDVNAVEHHAALPYSEIPEFMAKLRAVDHPNARALEFLILTAARLGEVAAAEWSEIKGDVWEIPAARMKSKRDHRVPLSNAAQACLARGSRAERYIFENRKGGPLYAKTITRETLPALKAGITTHGFRSTFRTWAADKTSCPREIAEAALAHAIGNKVEAAYQRGDLFDKRRALMDDWANYCARTAGE